MAQLDNLPAILADLIDGNLSVSALSSNPIYLVLGTAPRGTSENLYSVDSVSEAAQAFGRDDGTLVKGMYEAVAGGAENLRLFRVGATAAVLSNVGTGITITTNAKDAGAGHEYKLFWDDTALRLRIWRVADDLLVYDNNPTYPSAAVDENELSISGTATTGSGDIGSLSNPLTLANADGVSGASYTAGGDGILLSRMELFEALYKAYLLLEDEEFDIVVPQNVYLDDSNVKDMTTAEVSALNTSAPWAASSVYPTAGSAYDALGKVFAQEYQGEWYFWWDMDNDGVAEIYPTAGSSGPSTDAFGDGLSASDFHEANFGYQLANFCHQRSVNYQLTIAAIGVLPPVSWSLKDVSNWIGREPTVSEDTNGNSVITTNGTGLLGLKWLAGRKYMAGTGLPGLTINGIDGLSGGGFIATDDGWPDGSQQKDRNNHVVDIGKYLSITAGIGIMSNSTSDHAYAGSCANVYMGLVSSLPSNSAPTNKLIPGVRLPFRISPAKLDKLAGYRYVMLQRKPKGIVVADAPSAARTDSDYQRLTTIRIVKTTIDALRAIADPFLGEAVLSGPGIAALDNALEEGLIRLQKTGYLQRFDKILTSTPSQRVQGKADLELLLVPAWELRQLTIHVALAAQ